MVERYRSSAARELVAAIRRAGGTVERRQGRLVVIGPAGQVTIAEPGGETRRDLRRSSAATKIQEKTGLVLE
jgi:hypothetical protein